jgi:hypothetical protein
MGLNLQVQGIVGLACVFGEDVTGADGLDSEIVLEIFRLGGIIRLNGRDEDFDIVAGLGENSCCQGQKDQKKKGMVSHFFSPLFLKYEYFRDKIIKFVLKREIF